MMNQSKNLQRGLSLVELLTVVTLLGVITAVSLPSFRAMNESSQTVATTNALIGAMQLARSEAAKRGQTVSICAAAAGEESHTCLSGDSTSWEHGWLVFVDAQGSRGKIDQGDQVLRMVARADSAPAVSASGLYISYASNGLLNSEKLNWELRSSQCISNGHRNIAMSAAGRPSVSKVAC